MTLFSTSKFPPSLSRKEGWGDFQCQIPTRSGCPQSCSSVGTFPRTLLRICMPNCRNAVYPHYIPLCPGISPSCADFFMQRFSSLLLIYSTVWMPPSTPKAAAFNITPRQQGMLNIFKTRNILLQGSRAIWSALTNARLPRVNLWDRTATGNASVGRRDPNLSS